MLLFTVCLRIMWTFIKQCHQYPHLILCIFDLWPQKTWKHYIMTVIATLNWGHVLSSYDMLKVMKWMHLRGQWTAVSCPESYPRSLASSCQLRPLSFDHHPPNGVGNMAVRGRVSKGEYHREGVYAWRHWLVYRWLTLCIDPLSLACSEHSCNDIILMMSYFIIINN